ncbi:MAG: hypothetical protein ACREFE_14720 [Limisphaerales bacterium]
MTESVSCIASQQIEGNFARVASGSNGLSAANQNAAINFTVVFSHGAIAMRADISGDFASAFILPSGENGCAGKAVAMNAAAQATSIRRKANRFTTARRAAIKSENGKS